MIDARLSEDENHNILLGYSHMEVIDDYYYIYDIKKGNLHRVDQEVENSELYPMPDQDLIAFEANDWTAQDLLYYPPNSNTHYYPFKNLD